MATSEPNFPLTGQPQPIPQDGLFLLPLCITANQYQLMLDALYYARGLQNEADYETMDGLLQLLQAQRYVQTPEAAPCWPEEPPSADDDAPYWTDPSNSDGTDEDASDTWELIDVVVEGFLMTLNPGAAIIYRTFAPTARLLFQADSEGEVVEILINGVLATAIDTFVPGGSEIIEFYFDMRAFADSIGIPPTEQLVLELVHRVI